MATLYSKKTKAEKNNDFRCKCGIKLKNNKITLCPKCKSKKSEPNSEYLYEYWQSDNNNSQSKTVGCNDCSNVCKIAKNRTICLSCFSKDEMGYLT